MCCCLAVAVRWLTKSSGVPQLLAGSGSGGGAGVSDDGLDGREVAGGEQGDQFGVGHLGEVHGVLLSLRIVPL